jgi:hypothetical protein
MRTFHAPRMAMSVALALFALACGKVTVITSDAGRDSSPSTDARADARSVTDGDARADVTPPDVTQGCPGACAPGATRTVSCGNCGTETDTCAANCTWTAGSCMQEGVCSPGTTRMVSCSACQGRTDQCSSMCVWQTGMCTGACCEPIGGCASGSDVGGTCTGNGDDGCGGPCTCNGTNGESCSVSSGVGSCCRGSGWFCGGDGDCCPGHTCNGSTCS